MDKEKRRERERDNIVVSSLCNFIGIELARDERGRVLLRPQRHLLTFNTAGRHRALSLKMVRRLSQEILRRHR